MWAYILGALLGGRGGQAGTTAPQSYGPPVGQTLGPGGTLVPATSSPISASMLRPGTGRLYAQTGHIAAGATHGVAARQAYGGSVASFGAVSGTVSTYKAPPVSSAPSQASSGTVPTAPYRPGARRV